MLRYSHLAGVALNVTDVARSSAFYGALPGLRVDEPATDGAARFRVGENVAILELFQAPSAGLKRLAFALESSAILPSLVERVSRLGLAWRAVPKGVSIAEPHSGATVEFWRPGDSVRSESADDAICGFGHVVLRTPCYREAVAFWRDVLGFKVSDEIEERITLLRCFPNPSHHALGIANGSRRMFHHLNFHVRNGTDLGDIRRMLESVRTPIACGPGVHAPSGNRFLYFYDPDGLTLEMATIAEAFVEGSEREPRVLPDRPESFAIGSISRDPHMYTVGEIEDAD
jgi:2,3-dihydroxy-p-cumate/2,3-dihydroxybenzoate 3,4-dioxygenase